MALVLPDIAESVVRAVYEVRKREQDPATARLSAVHLRRVCRAWRNACDRLFERDDKLLFGEASEHRIVWGCRPHLSALLAWRSCLFSLTLPWTSTDGGDYGLFHDVPLPRPAPDAVYRAWKATMMHAPPLSVAAFFPGKRKGRGDDEEDPGVVSIRFFGPCESAQFTLYDGDDAEYGYGQGMASVARARDGGMLEYSIYEDDEDDGVARPKECGRVRRCIALVPIPDAPAEAGFFFRDLRAFALERAASLNIVPSD